MSDLFDIAACMAQKKAMPKPDMKVTIHMAGGGGLSSIKKNININGQPHKLSYINRDEASLLRQLGGSGRNVDGIPAYDIEGYDQNGKDDTDQDQVDEGEATGPGQGEQGALSDRGGLTDFFNMGPQETSRMGWGNPNWESDTQDALDRSLISAGLMQEGESAVGTFDKDTAFNEEDPGYLGYGPDFDPVTIGFPYDPMHISRRRRPPKKDYGELGPLEGLLSMYRPESYNPILKRIEGYNKKIKEKDITEKAVKKATEILAADIGQEKNNSIDLLRLADEVQESDARLADDLRGRVQDNINREIFSKFGPDPSFANELSTFGLATYGKGLWKKGERRTPFAMTKTEEETYLEPKEVGSILSASITGFEQMVKENPNLSVHKVLDKYNKERDTYHTAPLNMADLAGYGYKGAFAAGPQVAYSRRQRVKGMPSIVAVQTPSWLSKIITGKTPGGHLWDAGKSIFGDIVRGVGEWVGEKEKVGEGVKTVEDTIKEAKKIKGKAEKIYKGVTDPLGTAERLVRGKATDFLLDHLIGKDQYTPERIIYEEEAADLIKNKWKPIEGKAYSGQGTSQLPYLSPDYIKAREAHMLGKYNISDMDQQGLSGRGKFYHRGRQLSKKEQDELLNQHRQSTSWPRWRRATGGLVTLLPDDRDPSDIVILQDLPIDT